MANHKSAAKKAKQDVARRLRNRSGKSRLRTALKKYRALTPESEANFSKEYNQIAALIDQSAKHGFIHRNAADRLKSKCAKLATKLAG